jgi:hypothetical protein
MLIRGRMGANKKIKGVKKYEKKRL